MTPENLHFIASQFCIDGNVTSIKLLGTGFINDTYIVSTSVHSPNYILQRKNHHIFHDVPSMMENIRKVTNHLRTKVIEAHGDPSREVLTITPNIDGKLYYRDDSGNYWAASLFIDNTITYNIANTLSLAFQGGSAIGKFQSQLSDFTLPLAETIKGFHDIKWRFAQWDESLAADKANRKRQLGEEIEWIESRREQMLSFWALVEDGSIPMRVTHNDTKISNLLFDNRTNEVICVIDLDTVMNSTSLNDFGDAIRSYTNTGAEDDRDLDNVSMNFELFESYTKGFLSQRRNSLTAIELGHLPFSARYITYEQVLRFLMDYIDGDKYYKIAYPEHNLIRTHAQYKLLRSIESQYDKMKEITL